MNIQRITIYCKCEVCDKHFEKGRKASRFCSAKCRQMDYRIRKGIRDGLKAHVDTFKGSMLKGKGLKKH